MVDDLYMHFGMRLEVKVFGLEDLSSRFSFANGVRIGKYGFDSELLNKVKSWGPNLIHLHGMFTLVSWSAWRASKSENIPLIVSPHGMLDTWALSNSRLKKKLFWHLIERRVLGSAARIHALNACEEASIRNLLLANSVINCIPNGVSLSLPVEYKARGARFKLLYLGRLHPKKGIVELLQALFLCANNRPDLLRNVEVNIVGWGDAVYVTDMKRLAVRLGLENLVFFRGPAFGANKNEYFMSSNAFILPSYSEGLPMAVLEAWSFGLPVLMTSECNLNDGFTCNAAIQIKNDPQKMSACLVQLFETPSDQLQEMGKRGLDLVTSKYSWGSVAEQYLKMYEEVLVEHEVKKLSKSTV